MAQTSIFSTPLHCCRPCALETVSMGEERQRNSGHAVPEPQRFHSLNHRSGRRCFGALLSTKPRPTLAPRPPHARAHSPARERMSRRARGPREDGATRLRPRDHPPRPQMCIISDACSSGPGPKTSKVGEPARRHSSSRTGARRPVSLRCPPGLPSELRACVGAWAGASFIFQAR